MPPIYKKPELLYLVAEAVSDSGWNIIYLNDAHPFKVKIFSDSESYFVKFSIYNITHGGGAKRSHNEYRIQVKEPVFEIEKGYKTLILGYFDQLQVFAGFDITKHQGPIGYSASFQIREENLLKASLNGFSACDKGNQEIAIAFKPDFFVEYVRNLESLHLFGESQRDIAVLEGIALDQDILTDEILHHFTPKRQLILQTFLRKKRESSFRARVLRAYNYRCAFSGIQLRLIDAAHIIPVSYDNSTDETSNGIALSALHHKAYDKGLVTFDESYRIVINKKEVARLKSLNLDGGWISFEKNLNSVINPPPALADRPKQQYIAIANKLRGWL
jgi:putative restriction endonuclease